MWDKFGKQLGLPTRSLRGWFVSKFLRGNRALEENAVRLSGIQPGDTVLEVGHGPGLGLRAASALLTQDSGRVIGVDYSQYMHQMAGEWLQELVASGRLTLHLCDVAAMPIDRNTVDKVFHCNCYYFWPDLRKGAAEIHRVMKPGGLMVTTLILPRVKLFASKGLIPKENSQPDTYMEALRDSGFVDVRMEDVHSDVTFQAIYATSKK